jgi:hypothetical protein
MKIAIVVLALVVVASVVIVPANASAYLTIFGTMKFPEVQKDGTTQYTLKDVDELSNTRDNASVLVNSIGYGKPTVIVYHNGTISGKFLQVYTRPDGSKYVMPVSIYLEAKRDYQPAVIKYREEVNLTGTGSVNGHEGKINGSALLWVYKPGIPAFEIGFDVGGIPEW